jgi:hypothetical protein
MAKSSRSKKGQAPAKQPEANTQQPGADVTPANDTPKDDDFEHATLPMVGTAAEKPVHLPLPEPIQWPPAPPPPKVTVVPPLPKPVPPISPPPPAATVKPTPPAPPPARVPTVPINAHHRVNLCQIVAYRLDKVDAVVMIGADGVQYHARGEYAAAIRAAIGA